MCHIVPGVFQPNRKHNSVQLWHTLPQTLKFTPHTSIFEYCYKLKLFIWCFILRFMSCQLSLTKCRRRKAGGKVCASWKLCLYSNSCICVEKQIVFVLKSKLYLCWKVNCICDDKWIVFVFRICRRRVCTYPTWLPGLVRPLLVPADGRRERPSW